MKPANFTIGAGNDSRRILMIDFGLARKFVDEQGNATGKARAGVAPWQQRRLTRRARSAAQRPKAQFRGSSKYASIYAHQNEDQGRRDDLWSLFYVLIEFIEGVLPWTEARAAAAFALRVIAAADALRSVSAGGEGR